MKRPLLLFLSLSICLSSGAPSLAFAQGDEAGASALFYEARGLMQKGQYAAACPKLEESLRLDYGVGTEFNLADCNEQIGKLATAWSGFLNAAAAAKARNQLQREKVARDRAKALEPRLPKLLVEVVAPTPGMEVKRDGVVVGAAAWGTPVPVDPGLHKIVVTAPGKEKWETSATAAEGTTTRITIPRELPNAAVATAPAKSAEPPPPPTPIVPPPAPPVQTTAPPQPPPVSTDFPAPVVERGQAQRTIGLVVGAIGLAGIGVGVGFGLRSLSKREDSNQHCNGDLCDAAGVDLRDDAIEAGNIATVASIGGGAAILGSIILLATAPSGERPISARASSTRKIRAVPHIAAGGGGLSLEGVLP